MAVLNRLQCDVLGLVGGPGLMTFHRDPLATGQTDQDFADSVETFLTSCALFVNTSIVFRSFDYVEYFEAADGQVNAQQPIAQFGVAGQDATAVLPPVNQLLIRWATGVWVEGRQLKGKTFLPGLCEDSNEPGGVPQGAVSDAVALAANVLAADTGLVVWSRTHGVFQPVSVASVSSAWAYLSGRRDG